MATIDPGNLIQSTANAYAYPLLIKQLLPTPLAVAPEQEIIYRDLSRYNYRTLGHRIAQLANGLSGLGVHPGDTVGMMDWDSHRYLESYFAVPMMGGVLMTVNVRLSPEQIAYTINHAEAHVLLVNVEFLPLLEEIRDKLETVKTFIYISDIPSDSLPANFACEYEALLHAASPHFDFPDFDGELPQIIERRAHQFRR